MDQFQGYKVMQYTEHYTNEQLFAKYSDKPNDWVAIYIQLDYKHAMTYIYTKYEIFKDVCLLKFTFNNNIKFIKISNQIIADSNISSQKKAELVRQILKQQHLIVIDINEPLMDSLGRLGIGLIMEDSENQFEFIVPHSLLQYQNCCEIKQLVRFIRHNEIIFRTIKIFINDQEKELQYHFRDSIHLYPLNEYQF